MEDFQYKRFPSLHNVVRVLQRRGHSLEGTAKRHIEYWQSICQQCNIEYTVTLEPELQGIGRILGKDFYVQSELVAVEEDVMAEIRVTTIDSVSKKRVVVDSYYLNANGHLLSTVSKQPLKLGDAEERDFIEYQAVTEVLYSLATRSSVNDISTGSD